MFSFIKGLSFLKGLKGRSRYIWILVAILSALGLSHRWAYQRGQDNVIASQASRITEAVELAVKETQERYKREIALLQSVSEQELKIDKQAREAVKGIYLDEDKTGCSDAAIPDDSFRMLQAGRGFESVEANPSTGFDGGASASAEFE